MSGIGLGSNTHFQVLATDFSHSLKHSAPQTNNICLKIFIVVVVILSAIATITGVLGLLACKGAFAAGINSVASLKAIGEVNSYVMMGGGFIFFILGMISWGCQLKQESRAYRQQ